MPAKKTTFKKTTAKTKASEVKPELVESVMEPQIMVSEAAEAKADSTLLGSEQGMILAGGVEVIGMLGLVALVYATLCLYMMY